MAEQNHEETVSVGISNDDKLWALLAHVLTIIGFCGIPVLGNILPPLIIYLVKKEESQFVAFHAKQSLFFQIALVIFGLVYGIITFILSFVFIGLLLIPLGVLIALGAIVYIVIVGVKAYQGEKFEYWLIGEYCKK